MAANRRSLPSPSFSARATETSFADLIARAWIASETVRLVPAGRPSLVGLWAAARAEMYTGSFRDTRPEARASKVR